MPVAQTSPGHPLTGVLTRCAPMPGVTSRPPTSVVLDAAAPTPTLPQRGEGALLPNGGVPFLALRGEVAEEAADALEPAVTGEDAEVDACDGHLAARSTQLGMTL
jgi:hypothetical protein